MSTAACLRQVATCLHDRQQGSAQEAAPSDTRHVCTFKHVTGVHLKTEVLPGPELESSAQISGRLSTGVQEQLKTQTQCIGITAAWAQVCIYSLPGTDLKPSACQHMHWWRRPHQLLDLRLLKILNLASVCQSIPWQHYSYACSSVHALHCQRPYQRCITAH